MLLFPFIVSMSTIDNVITLVYLYSRITVLVETVIVLFQLLYQVCLRNFWLYNINLSDSIFTTSSDVLVSFTMTEISVFRYLVFVYNRMTVVLRV